VSEQSEQTRATPDEAPRVESAELGDTDLENVAGGATGGNAVVNGGGGYTSAKPSP